MSKAKKAKKSAKPKGPKQREQAQELQKKAAKTKDAAPVTSREPEPAGTGLDRIRPPRPAKRRAARPGDERDPQGILALFSDADPRARR